MSKNYITNILTLRSGSCERWTKGTETSYCFKISL